MDTLQLEHRAHVAFHLTGNRLEGALNPLDGLRPALFASYSDLTRLRYDFPVVLTREHADTPFVSLSSLIDSAFENLAPQGAERERVRKLLLRHEAAIRGLIANGTTGSLGRLWKLAGESTRDDADAATLAQAATALGCDGQVLDCDAAMPVSVFMRTWRFAQQRKTRKVRALLERLILGLSDILRADHAASDAARTPRQLQASIGAGFEDAFDFERMSAMLTAARPEAGLSVTRRRRIEDALAVLESQQFFRAEDGGREPAEAPYAFVCTSCAGVEEAYRERMPRMIALAKALAIAALEAKGEYDEAQHDPIFEAFGANGLTTEELAQFPDYLLWLYTPSRDEYGELMALLAGNVPVKVLVQFDDLLEETPGGNGRLMLSARSKQLADLAIGLNSVYVLQSSASNLVQMKARILSGLAYSGPALFSVYSGARGGSRLPAYLVAAAAMECRAFPAFTYDPGAGADWAARFSIEANPQPERDWPLQPFAYEDARHQRVAGAVAFTLADFLACDPRYARHFAQVPAAQCNGDMLTVRDWLAQEPGAAADRVPSLMMVDCDDVLQRVIVDAQAIEEAKRCRAMWHSLQELGGIHNSHAERLLARERQAWEGEKQHEIEARGRDAGSAVAAVAAVAAAPAPAVTAPGAPTVEAAPAEDKSPDEAYIETPRCTTCEECMQINSKMFVYDANKQAYIADIGAGTYRQLVEAAEACQVSIIHPGKPRNAGEPGVEELIRRAEAFG